MTDDCRFRDLPCRARSLSRRPAHRDPGRSGDRRRRSRGAASTRPALKGKPRRPRFSRRPARCREAGPMSGFGQRSRRARV